MTVVRIEAGQPAPLGATPVASGLDIAVCRRWCGI